MIPAFTNQEIITIRELLSEQFQKDIEIHLSDSEVSLGGEKTEPTPCPAVSWYVSETNFVVIKTGSSRFRTRFFHNPQDQYDTGVEEYITLDQCVAAVLHAQSEHQRTRLCAAHGDL